MSQRVLCLALRHLAWPAPAFRRRREVQVGQGQFESAHEVPDFHQGLQPGALLYRAQLALGLGMCWMPQLHLLRRRNAGGTLAVSHTPFSAWWKTKPCACMRAASTTSTTGNP